MASRAEVEQFQRAVNSLSARAEGELKRVWRNLDVNDLVGFRRSLERFWPALVSTYGEATAELAGSWFEMLTGQPATVAADFDDERANARMRWGMGSAFNGEAAVSLATLGVLVDELVKQPARDTLTTSAYQSGLRFARVPSGAETCAFCLMLAGRGAVYESADSAGDLGQYHGRCDCVPTPMEGEEDYPEGYDPDELEEKYLYARGAAKGDTTKDILRSLREREGIH